MESLSRGAALLGRRLAPSKGRGTADDAGDVSKQTLPEDNAALGNHMSAPEAAKRRRAPWFPGLSRIPGRWLAAVLCLALGTGAGWITYATLSPTYESTTAVLVLPTSVAVDAPRAGGDVQIETEAELARSAQVAAIASNLLDGRVSEQELLVRSEVTVPSNSQVLAITYSAGTAELARDGAAALASGYLERRSEDAADQIAQTVAALEAQATEVNSRLDQLAASPAAQADAGTTARFEADSQRSLLLDQLADINSRLVPLRTSGSGGGEVITAASLPAAPASPSPWLTVGAGVALGLVAALGVLLAHDPARSRATTMEPIDPAMATPVLVTIRTGELVGDYPERRGQIDSLLKQVLAHPSAGGPLAVVALSDPGLTSSVAMSLAEAWSCRSEESVLVLSEPGHVLAGQERNTDGPGLADVLHQEASLREASMIVSGSGVRLMGAGEQRDGSSPNYRAGLAGVWWRLAHDHGPTVVVTASPVDSTIALEVVRSAGRILIVVDTEEYSGRLAATVDELAWWGLGQRVAGAVALSGAGARGS